MKMMAVRITCVPKSGFSWVIQAWSLFAKMCSQSQRSVPDSDVQHIHCDP